MLNREPVGTIATPLLVVTRSSLFPAFASRSRIRTGGARRSLQKSSSYACLIEWEMCSTTFDNSMCTRPFETASRLGGAKVTPVACWLALALFSTRLLDYVLRSVVVTCRGSRTELWAHARDAKIRGPVFVVSKGDGGLVQIGSYKRIQWLVRSRGVEDSRVTGVGLSVAQQDDCPISQ